jgi:hypothetical protein
MRGNEFVKSLFFILFISCVHLYLASPVKITKLFLFSLISYDKLSFLNVIIQLQPTDTETIPFSKQGTQSMCAEIP